MWFEIVANNAQCDLNHHLLSYSLNRLTMDVYVFCKYKYFYV